MSGRGGYRSVSAKRPCAVCGSDSWCRETTDSFRLKVQRRGVLEEVEAPGTYLCMRSVGGQPGWNEHGTKGTSGGQHYVPASVYAAIKGGKVDGVAFDAEAAARRRRAEQMKEHAARMKARQAAGKLWGMARSEGERRAKIGERPWVEAEIYLAARLGRAAERQIGKAANRAAEQQIGRAADSTPFASSLDTSTPGHLDTSLPYCIRSVPKLGYYEVDDAGEVHNLGESPALLAAAIDPNGKVCGIQRIYLNGDSTAKRVGVGAGEGGGAKKFLGDMCPGAAVRIGTKEEFENPSIVIVCEGVETGWALRVSTGLPVLCMISTSGLKNITLPAEWTDSQLGKLRSVVFAADHDRLSEKTGKRAGIEAARVGADRLRRELDDRIRIEIAVPRAVHAPGLIGEAPGRSDEFGDVIEQQIGRAAEQQIKAEGKTVDWLDVYRAMGADVVWKGVIQETGNADRAAERQIGRAANSEVAGRVDGVEGSARSAGDGEESLDPGLSGRGRGGAGRDRRAGVGGDGEGSTHGAAGGGLPGDGSDGGGARAGEEPGGDFGHSGPVGGGAGGGGEKKPDIRHPTSDIPPILPRGHLAQAREYLKGREALSPSAAGRAGERWELVYSPASASWLAYRGTHFEPVAGEVLAGKVLDHFEPYHVLKKAEPGDKLITMPDGTTIATKRAAITYGNAESVVKAMVGDCAVHAESLPAWSSATFDGAGMPIWGRGLNAGAGAAAPATPLGVSDAEVRAGVAGGRGGGSPLHSGTETVIAVKNGLLRLDALMENRVTLERHTPRYVSLTCAPFDLPAELIQRQIDEDPEDELAGGELVRKLCPHWLKFLDEVSGGCEIWVRELGKFFGLCLTDRVMDRAAFLVGQPRTGKGTIAETLIEVLGQANVVTSRLSALVGRHELHNFVGRNLLLFDELEVGHMTDTAEAVGRLKTIIAGTPVSADPKHKDAFTFRVLGKVLLTANKLPRLRDTSGALAGRLLVFPTQGESHVGREDYGLKDRLRNEARGILVWSLFHLRILMRQRRFEQPPDGKRVLENFKRLSSPIYAFLKDCMVEHEHGGVQESLLRRLYAAWADDAGLGRMGQETFLADLMATVQRVRRDLREPMGSATKERVLLGVRPRLFGQDEKRALETGTAEKAFVVWGDDLDHLDHYGFQFPAEDARSGRGTRTIEYPDAGSLMPPA